MLLASLKEAALSSEVEHLRSVAEKKTELNELLLDKCRMGESLNELMEALHKKAAECDQLRLTQERLRTAEADIVRLEEHNERGLSLQK